MTFDLTGGQRLLLAGWRLGGFWIAAGLAAVVLLFILYRAERRIVSRRAGLFLLGLRLAAASVLVAALFEPIASRVTREVQRGRVIVAVDVSQSMETADPGRTESERTALARAIRLTPGEDHSTLPRREVARRLIDGAGSPVARLADEHAIDARAFARTTAPASLAALAESLRSPAKRDDPNARETDWQPVLQAALRASSGEAPVLGVVLLTDGRQNAPVANDAASAADRLASRGVPVYPILIGSTVPPRDAAIVSVRAPETVYRGDIANVTATLKLDGYPGREVAVTLDRPGGSPMRQVVRVPADAGSSRPSVAFRVPLETAGPAALTLAVGPVDGDVQPANDRRALAIQVVDDRAEVLLVDGEGAGSSATSATPWRATRTSRSRRSSCTPRLRRGPDRDSPRPAPPMTPLSPLAPRHPPASPIPWEPSRPSCSEMLTPPTSSPTTGPGSSGSSPSVAAR